jgi:hypothetical protein
VPLPCRSPKINETAKHVESIFIACPDAGSNPASSTIEKAQLLQLRLFQYSLLRSCLFIKKNNGSIPQNISALCNIRFAAAAALPLLSKAIMALAWQKTYPAGNYGTGILPCRP